MRKANDARSRRWLLVAITATVILGLASRKYGFLLPDVFGNHPGDALWALALFFGFAFLKPTASRHRLAIVSLSAAYCVEFAQLYQAPWIKAIRANPVGHLVLGSTFVATDLLAYTVGIGCGFLLLPLLPTTPLHAK